MPIVWIEDSSPLTITAESSRPARASTAATLRRATPVQYRRCSGSARSRMSAVSARARPTSGGAAPADASRVGSQLQNTTLSG